MAPAYLPRGLTLSSRASRYRGSWLRTHHVLVAVVTNAAVLVAAVWIRGHLGRVTSWTWEERETRRWGHTGDERVKRRPHHYYYHSGLLVKAVWGAHSRQHISPCGLVICILSHLAFNLLKGIMHMNTCTWISALSLYDVPGTSCIQLQ